jgi:hypothetical protein
MRVPTVRQLAALALAGASVAGVLDGCGKGRSAREVTRGEASESAPAAHGVLAVATKNTTRLGGADPAIDAAAVAQVVYPGLTPATRPQAVVLVDERQWPVALSAASLASAPLGAPILYAEGNELPAVSERALRALHPVGAPALGGAQVIRIGTTAKLPPGYSSRTFPASSDPLATAALTLSTFEAATGEADPRRVLVVASDAPRALQMPAAALSAESATPILFVQRARVPAATVSVLRKLRRPTIYVVAPATLGARSYAQLARLGTVVRVAGAAAPGEASGPNESEEPIANAISVSRFGRGTFGWSIHEAGHGLVFANASRPLDAPAAAPLSAHGDYGPLLLLQASRSLPAPLTHYLSDIEPGYTAAAPPVREVYNHGWLIGDEAAISALAQAELDAVLEIAPRQPSAAEQSVVTAE